MSGSVSVAVAAVCLFMQSASPAWPASAGAKPRVAPSKFKDPRPRFFDPPPGRYRLPDGSFKEADPPRGFYDPPPGYYALARPGLRGAAPDAVIGPLPTAEGSLQGWIDRRRQLRIVFGVSLGTIGVGALVPLIGLATQRGDEPCIDCYAPGTFVALIVVPIGIVATIATGIALGVHARRRPKPSRVQVTAGGLRMTF